MTLNDLIKFAKDHKVDFDTKLTIWDPYWDEESDDIKVTINSSKDKYPNCLYIGRYTGR